MQDAPPVIQFRCRLCQTQLTVDQSLAGVRGPCPSCGQDITAPIPGAPLEMKPRQLKNRLHSDTPLASPAVVEVAVEQPSPESVSTQGKRTVHPRTGLSEAHNEKKETAVVLKMLLAVVFVLAIVGIVVAFLMYR